MTADLQKRLDSNFDEFVGEIVVWIVQGWLFLACAQSEKGARCVLSEQPKIL